MAVVNTKSSLVQTIEAVPADRNPSGLAYARARTIAGTVAVAAADDDGSRYFLCPVMSHWRVLSIRLFNDAITLGTGYDVGLYETDMSAMNDAVYAATLDLSTASATGTEVAFQARDITGLGNRVYEDLALTADSRKMYYLALTADTVGTSDGDIAFLATIAVD